MSTRSVPRFADSTDKLLHRLALVSKDVILRDGEPILENAPNRIFLSPSLLRKFNCHTGCTACCLPFTLDFTVYEALSFDWSEDIEGEFMNRFHSRGININGETYLIMSYPQYKDDKCPFLRPTREGGALGCGFWTSNNSTQPLECAAAPQLLISTRGQRHPGTVLSKRPFGRASQWKVVPECEFDPIIDKLEKLPEDTSHLVDNEIMLLERYQHWAETLNIPTWIPQIITSMKVLPDLVESQGLHLIEVELK